MIVVGPDQLMLVGKCLLEQFLGWNRVPHTSVNGACEYWRVLPLNTCQYSSFVLASIVVCSVMCVGSMFRQYAL